MFINETLKVWLPVAGHRVASTLLSAHERGLGCKRYVKDRNKVLAGPIAEENVRGRQMLLRVTVEMLQAVTANGNTQIAWLYAGIVVKRKNQFDCPGTAGDNCGRGAPLFLGTARWELSSALPGGDDLAARE